MRREYMEQHWTDKDGNPAGGVSCGTGFTVSWQNGPLGRHVAGCEAEPYGVHATGCTRMDPNGAFVEDLIQAVIGRIEFYQTASDGRFNCIENELALVNLRAAAMALDFRTRGREKRSVEGTHEL